MYHNDYNLRQLLELALRVPEIGAVNFNILYHILKTVIEKQGLERVKPIFSLEGSVIAESVKSKPKVPLKRSLSAESLQTTKTSGVSKGFKDKGSTEYHAEDGYEKQSTKWNATTLYKRLDAVEDEISEFHVLISQLIDKIANFERVSGLQETKFMKEIADLKLSIQSNEEIKKLAQELQCLSSDVSMLKSEAILKTESEDEDQELPDYTKLDESRMEAKPTKDESPVKHKKRKKKEYEIKLSAKYERLFDELNEIKKYLNMEPICIAEKLEKTSTDEHKFIESSEGSDEEKEDKGEAKKVQDESEVIEKTEEDQRKVDEDQGKSNQEYPKRGKEIQRKTERDRRRKVDKEKGISERRKKSDEELEVTSTLTEKGKVQIEKGTVKDLTSSRKDVKDVKDFVISKKKDIAAQADISQWDFELLKISAQVNKLMEKCTAIDKTFSSDISALKEKNIIMEQTLSKWNGDIEALKTSWDGMVHSFERIRDDLENVEKEVTVLTELPGLRNRVELLEGYVYTGHEYEYDEEEEEKHRKMQPHAITPSEKFISKAEKITEKISVADRKAVEIFRPILKKTENRGLDFLEEGISEATGVPRRRFLAVSRNIALIRDMEKKKRPAKIKAHDFYGDLDEEEDYLYDEPQYETTHKKDEGFGVSSAAIASSKEMAAECSADIKTSTFTSPDILEEHSRQLRGQVIVFVKNRLHVFEIDLQHIESNLVTMKKKIEVLEKNLKDIGEKLMFMDANFNQRIGDLAALKEMAENHQVSIGAIMHHLDRKAEAYAVNQKVSRKELTVIEDRVVKLCALTGSEICKLEEKLSDSLEKFKLDLDKKLFTEEFEVRLEFLLHKIKILSNKFKDTCIEGPVLDFDDIRPVEIKKFVLCKDGTRVKEARKKVAAWKHRYTSESIIPVLTQHLPDREVSPKTAIQVQNELAQASIRDSKRYVEGTYTKIQVGRK